VPTGAKQREGDFRTPEGRYYLESRNVDSDYFLSILVSYPSDADRARAHKQGVEPGGQIMIHGLPNAPRYELGHYQSTDWTDGCIAVSNSDMVDIWLMTRESTPIEIRP
jgi:murein L,D-transpeptidase YafK